MIIITEWRSDEKKYKEEGNLNLTKDEIIKALIDLNADELQQYFKQHTKIRQHVSNNGYHWEEDDLDGTDKAFFTTIIEDDLRPILSGRKIWDIISKLLKICIVVYAPYDYDIIDHNSEYFIKLNLLVKPLINKLDPMGLLEDDAPDDEYSPEIEQIAGLLTVAKDLVGDELIVDDLQYIVSGVFGAMFSGEQISDDDATKSATALATIMQELDKIVFFHDEEDGSNGVTIPKELWEQKFQNIYE